MADALSMLLSLLAILWGTLVFSVPAFIAALACTFLYKWISKKLSLKWFKASLITTYICVFVVLLVFFFTPLLTTAFQQAVPDLAPDESYSGEELLALFFVSPVMLVIKLLAAALVISLLLMPLELIGSALFSWLQKKKKLYYVNAFISVFAATLAAVLVILAFPWIPAGILYFVYFA